VGDQEDENDSLKKEVKDFSVKVNQVSSNWMVVCFHFCPKSSQVDLEESLVVVMFCRTVKSETIWKGPVASWRETRLE
jgi:hypothetical protein